MLRSVLGLSLIALIVLNEVHCAHHFFPGHVNFVAHSGKHHVKREVTEEQPSSAKPTTPKQNDGPPKITNMHVHCNVSNRFAQTVISSRFANPSQNAQEATFSVVLPEKAYISGFVMEIGNKSYHAYVREKEAAKQEYQQAVQSGISAGHVAVSARDSNRFTVSVNVEPLSKVTFNVSYEQLLVRKDGLYDLVINLHPGQPVKDLQVEVKIAESRPIVNLRTPPLRSGNEIGDENADRDPRAEIKTINETAAVVNFSPSVQKQKEFAKSFGTKEEDGLAGQFVVQYDVERDPHGGEVLLNDGYFVHFFAPSDLKPLRKHVVFVLDISGSMWDRKMVQLKEAMDQILTDLHPGDLFNLVQFESRVQVWDFENPANSPIFPENYDSWFTGDHNQSTENVNFPRAYPANERNIKKAKEIVANLSATGGTNIYDAIQVALRLVEVEETSAKMQPIIMFLTDGDPTVGITNTNQIVSKVIALNDRPKPAALFTLSFGDGADKEFLKKLALGNLGFSRHIYEASDATLQLQDFYRQISSPLLSKVHFKYSPNVVSTSLTKNDFPILFNGSELVVCGKYPVESSDPVPQVSAWGINGPIDLIPRREQSFSGLERLWAYVTIQQLMDQRETAENKTETEKKALDLALKYSFVTPVSSLVVVKPNATAAVETEAAKAGLFGSRGGTIAYPGVGSKASPMLARTASHPYSIPQFHRHVMAPSSYSGGLHRYQHRSRARPTFSGHTGGYTSSSAAGIGYNIPLNEQISARAHVEDSDIVGGGDPSRKYLLQSITSLSLNPGYPGQGGPLLGAAGPYGIQFASALVPPAAAPQSVNYHNARPIYTSTRPTQNYATTDYDTDKVFPEVDSAVDVRLEEEDVDADTVPTTSTSPDVQDLDSLTWLSSIKIPANDSITLPGGNYPLGSNSNTTAMVPCDLPITSNRTAIAPGMCTLIKDCPEIYPELTEYSIYASKYFCEIEGYAGVCCEPPSLP